MTVIKKKIRSEYFDAVASGAKKCELRLNDFEVNEGDILVLEEWDPKTKSYTGRSIEKKVTHVAKFLLDTLFWPKEEVEEKGIQIISLAEEQKTRVAVGVMILKDGKMLLAKRKTSHGAGEYAFPGGHLEYMETFEDCARRETKEECGITIKNIRFQFVANLKIYAPKHYAHIGVIADWESGEPQPLEPEKSESWTWYDLDKLPQPMFKSCELALESYRKETIYYNEIV